MRIGLINVDEHHYKKRYGSAYPNLALGKIARYHKMKGNEVEWARPVDLFSENHYDIIYASKVGY